MVYSGTCLTCAQKGPPSKIDREGNVVILPAPPLTSPIPHPLKRLIPSASVMVRAISQIHAQIQPNTINTVFEVHTWTVGTPNMVKWVVPEKILQNVVQMH